MDSSSNSDDKDLGMLDSVSKGGQNFFKKFLWKLLYDIRHKNIENLSQEEKLDELIYEINKPKLKEIFQDGRKKFEFKEEGKDILVFNYL